VPSFFPRRSFHRNRDAILAGEIATSGQFILVAAALTAMLVFHKQKMVDWKLALIIDPPTDVMAFVGGYFSGLVSGVTLKNVA